MKYTATLFLLTNWMLQSAEAIADETKFLARCGVSGGQTYYFEGGLVGPGQGGWKPDGYKNGRINIIINSENKIDVIIKDGNGIRGYLADRVKVALTSFDQNSRSFIVSAYSDKFAGTYLVKLNELGLGTIAWTESKITSGITRSSLMVAECGPTYTIK